MKKMCLILSVILIFGGLSACAKKDSNPESTTESTASSQQQPDEDDRFAGIDYQNETIDVFTWTATDEWVLDDSKIDQLSVMDFASYQHLKNVENELNVNFNIAKKVVGGWGSHENFILEIEKNSGQQIFDLICQYSLASIYGAQRMLYKDLNGFDQFDGWNGSYWNRNLISSNTVNGKIYYVTGEMTPTTVIKIGCMVFNRALLDNYYDSLDLYQIVDDGDWTLDRLISLTKDIYVDANNDRKRGVGDRFGFVIPANNVIDLLQYGADLPCIVKDEEDRMIINPQFREYGEKAISLSEKVRSICWDYEGMFLGYTPLTVQDDPNEKGNAKYMYNEAMENGNAVFQLMWAHNIIKNVREAGIDYGILPIPKYDTAQKEYHTALEMTYSMFSIPADCKDPEMVATVMEVMGMDGNDYLVPQIFEQQLKSKYSNTPEDAKMFDLLRNGIIYEPGRIFSYIDCFALFRRNAQYDREWTAWYMEQAGSSYDERLSNILFELQ